MLSSRGFAAGGSTAARAQEGASSTAPPAPVACRNRRREIRPSTESSFILTCAPPRDPAQPCRVSRRELFEKRAPRMMTRRGARRTSSSASVVHLVLVPLREAEDRYPGGRAGRDEGGAAGNRHDDAFRVAGAEPSRAEVAVDLDQHV